MTASSFALEERDASQIKLFCDLAKMNGAALTVEEIVALVALPASKEELERAWNNNPILSTNYELQSGVVVERNRGGARFVTDWRVFREIDRRDRAKGYLKSAVGFSALCSGRYSKLVAVSGSASYRSVSRTDDLDFFCVTQKDSLWIFLTRTLILARLYRRFHKDSPKYCFSCNMDESFALESFATSESPLFGRDALNAVLLYGNDCYQSLLARGAWMRNYYPRLYESKFESGGERPATAREGPSAGERVLNLFLYYTVGSYIKLKSALLNRRFLREGRGDSLFTVRSGPDHCMYESQKYTYLEKSYSNLEEKNTLEIAGNFS